MFMFRKKVRFKTVCLAAVIATGMISEASMAADPKIDLRVIETSNGYKLEFMNSECPGDPAYMGCVDVAQGSKNWIQWELDEADWQDGWVLEDLQLSWNDPQLTNCVVNDFDVNPNTGYARDFRVQGNGKFGKLRDENDCEFAYQVNYLISARKKHTGDTANSDPIIRNGGRN